MTRREKGKREKKGRGKRGWGFVIENDADALPVATKDPAELSMHRVLNGASRRCTPPKSIQESNEDGTVPLKREL